MAFETPLGKDPPEKIKQAQDKLQTTIDRYTTKDDVNLTMTSDISTTHGDDPGDNGFSYMALRAYGKKYSKKPQALKAALLLSKKFMEATGDSKLKVQDGDTLTIGKDKAVLTLRKSVLDPLNGKTVSTKVSYTVSFEDGAKDIPSSEQGVKKVREGINAELDELKKTPFKPLEQFAGNLVDARKILKVPEDYVPVKFKEETQYARISGINITTLSERPDYLGYRFLTITVLTEGTDELFNQEWALGFNPTKGEYLILDRTGKTRESAKTLEGAQRALGTLMQQERDSWNTPATGEKVAETTPSKPLKEVVLKALVNKGYRSVGWEPHRFGQYFGIESFTVTAIQDGTKEKVRFYIAHNRENDHYQFGDQWRGNQPWQDRATFMQALDSRLT